MLIDCDRCEMRDIACRDCVVTALIDDERAADTGWDAPVADAGQHGAHAAQHGAHAAAPGAPAAQHGAPAARHGARRTPGAHRRGGPGGDRGPDRDRGPAGTPAPGPDISEPERQALRTLAAAGLVPPLRLTLPEGMPEAEAS